MYFPERIEQTDDFEKDARAGVMERLKHKAFYVDVNPDGALASTPWDIPRGEAEVWGEHARYAISSPRHLLSA